MLALLLHLGFGLALSLAAGAPAASPPASPAPAASPTSAGLPAPVLTPAAAARLPKPARIILAEDPQASDAFKPDAERVRWMVDRGLTALTQKRSATAAWLSLVAVKDVVGLKVCAAPGPDSGTRPAVVAALVEGMLQAGLSPTNIVVWDRRRSDLRRAGFLELQERFGIRLEGSADAGFDEETAYSPERPVLGQLVYGDLEFGRKGEGVGRRSFVSRLLTHQLTKIITVTPLLNHNSAGVNGHLFSLSLGSVDNVLRFEGDLFRLATAVPEIYALPAVGDKVVLNVTDALTCQYQGEQVSLLHYAVPLNQLWLSQDPVALDVMGLQELERVRVAAGGVPTQPATRTNQMELFLNASVLLELGNADLGAATVQKVGR